MIGLKHDLMLQNLPNDKSSGSLSALVDQTKTSKVARNAC